MVVRILIGMYCPKPDSPNNPNEFITPDHFQGERISHNVVTVSYSIVSWTNLYFDPTRQLSHAWKHVDTMYQKCNILYRMRTRQWLLYGQKGNSLRERIYVHRQQIRDTSFRTIPLNQHLYMCAKGDLHACLCYKIDFGSITARRTTGNRTIEVFNPKLSLLQRDNFLRVF